MRFGRAESRTEQGWQRFDRVAFLVGLMLILALLIVWAFAPAPGPGSQAVPQLGASEGASGDASDPGSTSLAVVDTEATDAATDADKRDSDRPTGGNQSAVSLPTITPESAKSERRDPSSAGDKSVDASAKTAEAAQPNERSNDPIAATISAAKAASGAGGGTASSASSGKDENKSLASQDPARQATFERIPKYLDKPIAAAAPQLPAASLSSAADNGAAPGQADSAVAGLPPVVMAVGDGPSVKPILELRAIDGGLTIDGIVSSEKVRADILKAGLKAFGMRNLTDRLAVNGAVEPFQWAGEAADLIVLIGGPESETTVRIDGTTVTLAGEVPGLADKEARALAAQQLFGTQARVDNRLRVVAPAASAAIGRATSVDSLPGQQSANSTGATDATAGATAAAASAVDDNSLAEGGPGQTDTVTLAPTSVPNKIPPGECPKVVTGVLLPFGSASVELTDAAKATLDLLMSCFSGRNYIVGGHTDGRGLASNNRKLSQERAQAVVDYLLSQGAPASRLTATGYGESRPIVSNRSERGRARNRRVDFRIKR
ncbi:MAG: OmpA family protein [Burkholderiaceae bacterium]